MPVVKWNIENVPENKCWGSSYRVKTKLFFSQLLLLARGIEVIINRYSTRKCKYQKNVSRRLILKQ
jgi:hypothetical protein